MAEGQQRAFREHVDTKDGVRLPDEHDEHFEKDWTDWEHVMGPPKSLDAKRISPNVGTRKADRDIRTAFKKGCGIYEMAYSSNRANAKLHVVYVGSTCRAHGDGIKKRILEYCWNGDHKNLIINQALDHGKIIYASAQYVKDGEENPSLKAAEAGNYLLARYDYAWNLRNNDKDDPRPVRYSKRQKRRAIPHYVSFCA